MSELAQDHVPCMMTWPLRCFVLLPRVFIDEETEALDALPVWTQGREVLSVGTPRRYELGLSEGLTW